MNSFDEVQCEETADAQMIFNMEEMAVYQAWIEVDELRREAVVRRPAAVEAVASVEQGAQRHVGRASEAR